MILKRIERRERRGEKRKRRGRRERRERKRKERRERRGEKKEKRMREKEKGEEREERGEEKGKRTKREEKEREEAAQEKPHLTSPQNGGVGCPVDNDARFVWLHHIEHALRGVEVTHRHGLLQRLLDALVLLHVHLHRGGREGVR